MPLKLIHGPPNSGRRGLIRRRFAAALDRDPILVVPTADDVFDFERELCGSGALLGGSVTTFHGLVGTVAAACGAPPAAALSHAQRLRVVAVAIEECRGRLGPLRRSASREGFAVSIAALLDELQGAGLGPGDVEAGAGTLERSAYLADLATLFASYERVRARGGRGDSHGAAREAIRALRTAGAAWRERPVFVYGLDDLTGNQLELIRALAAVSEVTIALAYEERAVLDARARLLQRLREGTEIAAEETTGAIAANTESAQLFELERRFGVPGADPVAADGAMTVLRSAGERGEAEAIASAVGRLIHQGAAEGEVAIVLRDPARRGPLLARVLESYGIGTALETDLPVAASGVGGALIALLEAEHGARRAEDVLRWLRGPSGVPASNVDWLERSIRRGRVRGADEALALWQERHERLPADLVTLREAERGDAAAALAAVATRMATRFLNRGEGDGPLPARGDGVELRAAAEIAAALSELAELGALAPSPEELIGFLRDLSFRVWSGPVEGRVRIADPRRLRASRFDHVVIGSLQDGEFPRRGGGDPFLSDALREALGLEPRRDEDREERYLFYSSLSLPRRSLVLSYRESDEAGAAEARSPLLDDVLALLAPATEAGEQDAAESSVLFPGRGLADVAYPAAAAPSRDELARALAAAGGGADRGALLETAGAEPDLRATIERRLERAAAAERASRAPGPLRNPAVLESLRSRPAFGGTTLERFDVCSYIWFADHELRPQPLDPAPDAIVQGGIVHRVLDLLYRERPNGEARPRPASLATWTARATQLVEEVSADGGLGTSPPERALRRGAERLLTRFLAEEAGRDGAFEPLLLEAAFGEDGEAERPALRIGDWLLHGAIDRVDAAPDGRALIHDYKVASRVSQATRFEEEAKLQLPLYALAVAEHWGLEPVGALYHPLRGTRERRPRGLLLASERDDFAPYGPVATDLLDREEFEAQIESARQRASRIVARMRAGDITRDPGPRPGLRDHDVCPAYCALAPICRRDRTPLADEERESEET